MTVLNSEQINENLKDLQGWSFRENALHKSLTFTSFRDAVSGIVRISYEAEEMNHHPNLSNVYNRVDISLNTHDAGGVTEKDFALAARIDKVLE
jgi:4a-hydroxytetrahydrobiopterin dehydratase